MAVVQHHFYSAALTECNSMTVIVPIEARPQSTYPVLWLLSPIGCDHTAWNRHTDLEALAQNAGIMIVVPDMKLSFGVDMVHGFRYHTMLTEELPESLANCYPADLSRQVIAGVSEGAYIAMLASLTHPKQYSKTLAFSCGSMTDAVLNDDWKQPFFFAFGTQDPASLTGTAYDLKHLIRSADLSGWTLVWSDADPHCRSCKALAAMLPKHSLFLPGKKPLDWSSWYDLLKASL